MPEIREKQHDDFEVFDKINQRYFSEIEHSVPHFQQTLFDLQNECYKLWKNTINANVQLQKELLGKSGFNFVLPKITQKIIDNVGAEIVKYRLACIKIAITTIESGTKNVKTWNDSANTFLDLNRKIIHSWFLPFMPKPDTEK
ncbi:hypothetical protein NZNM25_12730 [Nitrosopumilus zosterae]|uniref:Uncharacterized protein n=1 Tax=Nitrosopumilus zosterae TaxID=718286 RepID=A0A2S2KS35_9ARCH|nr:hypothetical protein [Nitrosopumilus zosterae]BDQ30903.1 hypothetical protein NZOSNM25_001011 [Nitrosopumilus zosterae]GBH34482.1 hypothetical protein NZNM25_12730 [Nitrosopumilus zosterae]